MISLPTYKINIDVLGHLDIGASIITSRLIIVAKFKGYELPTPNS